VAESRRKRLLGDRVSSRVDVTDSVAAVMTRLVRGPARAFLAVGGAAALLAGCLAAGPLFLSTAATAATRVDLQGRCPGLVDANYRVAYPLRAPAISTFDRLAPAVPHSGTPALTDVSATLGMTLPRDDRVFRSALVVHRTGAMNHLVVDSGRGSSGVVVPDWFAAEQHVGVGQTLRLTPPQGAPEPVPIIGTYRDVVAGPNASFWCSLEPAFEANDFGDHRPPVLIMDDAGAAANPSLFSTGTTMWSLPLVGRPTATSTSAYLSHLGPLRTAGENLEARPTGGVLLAQLSSDLTYVVRRATTIRSFTATSIAPVRWSAALTGLAVVIAAALLFVRRNRREYRIRVLRGTRASRLGLHAAVRVAPATVTGAVTGLLVADLLVRHLGPSSDIATGEWYSAVRFAALGAALTLIVVALVVAVACRTFDRARSRTRAALRWVPFELAGAAACLVGYRHLVHTGGVRLAGAGATRIDPWAVFFPLLLLWTVIIALPRPLRALLGRVRLLGARARPAAMLGLRRAVSDPAIALVTSAAVAFCLATFVYSSMLSTSIDASLQAKAHTFVGADQRVGLTDVPKLDAQLASHTTVVTRGQGHYAGQPVTVLGVDPQTFAKIAYWQHGFAGQSLSRLLSSLQTRPNGPLPVLVAGDAAASRHGQLGIDQGAATAATVVGVAKLWPSMQSGDTFVIADRAALDRRGLTGVDEVWIRGLPDMVAAELAGHGVGVVYSIVKSSVLDFNNTLPVRWSLGLLSALGVVAGLAFAAVELAIVDSRARARQLAYLVWRRLGFSARDHFVACALELAVPAAVGAVAALGTALLTARIAVAHLDALSSLPPPASFLLTARPLLAGAIVVLLVLLGLSAWSQRVTQSGDAMELLRVAE
jgi:hypothetical protein